MPILILKLVFSSQITQPPLQPGQGLQPSLEEDSNVIIQPLPGLVLHVASHPVAFYAPVMCLRLIARLYTTKPPARTPKAVWAILALPQQVRDGCISSAQEQHSGGLPSSKHLAFNTRDK